MKKTIIFLSLLILPLSLFADFQIGGAAYLTIPMTPDQLAESSADDFSIDDMLFGLDARLNIGLFQACATMLFDSIDAGDIEGSDEDLQIMNLYTDFGIMLDLWLFRLSAGLGPNFQLVLDEDSDSDPIGYGANMKLALDLVLGEMSLGVNYAVILDDLQLDTIEYALENPTGQLGLSILFKLF